MTTMLILIILILIGSKYYTTMTGGGKRGEITHMLPFQSPFQSQFFHKTYVPYILDLDVEIHRDKLFQAIVKNQAIITRRNDSKNNPTITDIEVLRAISTGLLASDGQPRHIGVFTADMLQDAMINHPSDFTDIRAVCSLYNADIMVLVPNYLEILDFADIQTHYEQHHGKIRINVNNRGSSHELSCLEILNYLNLRDYVELTYFTLQSGEAEMQYGTGYDMAYHIDFHPSELIRMLSDKIPSHFVSLDHLGRDKLFHLSYSTYLSDSHHLLDLIPQKYPKLTIPNHLVIQLPTINTPYILVCHRDVEPSVIMDILQRIQSMIESHHVPEFVKDRVTPLHLSYIKVDLALHQGSIAYYRKKGYYVDNLSDHCLHYKVNCPLPKPEIFRLLERDARKANGF